MEVRSRRGWRVVAPLDAAAASGAWLASSYVGVSPEKGI
jgi:hypothetical protein